MNLFLDIETSGLPEKGAEWEKDYAAFPRIVEIAWKTGKKVNHHILQQEPGFKIPKSASDIHGITDKIAKEKGQDPEKILAELVADSLVANIVIGHNVFFDISIIKANILRIFGPKSKMAKLAIEGLHKDKRKDTMWIGYRVRGGKWPKLTELHNFLFGEDFEGAHGAAADMLACEKCFKELKRLGHV